MTIVDVIQTIHENDKHFLEVLRKELENDDIKVRIRSIRVDMIRKRGPCNSDGSD